MDQHIENLFAGRRAHFELLLTICKDISSSAGKVKDEHLTTLYQLFGKILPKALELVERKLIELATVEGTTRSYFVVVGKTRMYTLYKSVCFCNCKVFAYNLKKKKDYLCQHIVGCHLALATNKIHTRTCSNFVILEDT